MVTDRELLDRWVTGRSEEAFRELVERHSGLVYGACLRRLGHHHLAEEASQAVFVILSRKAGSLGRDAVLPEWLHRTARYVALNARRAGQLRRRREEAAARATRPEARPELAAGWAEVGPQLDGALDELPAASRAALVLHYLAGRSQREVAAELGCTEDAAKKRIAYALEKLRGRLSARGVALPSAALGTMLGANGIAAAPAGLASSIQAACLGQAAVPEGVSSIAEGAMKTMAAAKLKLAAAVVGAVLVLGGGSAVVVGAQQAAPLKATGEPVASRASESPTTPAVPAAATPSVVNPRVAAMGDNRWLKLEVPKVHPKSRSGSPWMPYAPEAGVGLLWGCVHSGSDNDIWSYNLARNEWKELLPTEPSAARDPDVLKIKDGVLMTRGERPLSYHGWGKLDYDPDRQVLWHTGGTWQGLYSPVVQLQEKGHKVKEEGDPEKFRGKGKGPLLWRYDLKSNKWSLVGTEDPSNCTRGYRHVSIRYCPPLKKLLMTPSGVSPNEEVTNWKAYDPDTNKWEALKIEWKALEGKAPVYWGGLPPMVCDSNRKALVLLFNGTWLLDPVKRTCEQLVRLEKTPAANLDGPIGAFVYDSVGDATLAIFVDYKVYQCEKTMQDRGFPVDEARVWALDIGKKAWVMQPKPADGVLPPLGPGMLHHYYDPVQNATAIYRGTYAGQGTETWVYRYKKSGS